MRVVAGAHASTRATKLGHWNEKLKEITKTSNLITDHFSLTLVNLLLA